jgi:hypothetical protein
MSLSQRLKEAEEQRRQLSAPPGDRVVTDSGGSNVIDLTDARIAADRQLASDDQQPLEHALRGARLTAVSPTGIAYDPVRNGDATSAFHDPDPMVLDRLSSYECPRCGGETQVDLIDQVHQTVSLSCLECFHMFRVES